MPFQRIEILVIIETRQMRYVIFLADLFQNLFFTRERNVNIKCAVFSAEKIIFIPDR